MKRYKDLSRRQKNDVFTIISDVKKESIVKLYDSFVNILETIKDEKSIELIKTLPRIKPIFKVHTLLDLLKELSENVNAVHSDFVEVKKYNGFDIDVFILLNMINI